MTDGIYRKVYKRAMKRNSQTRFPVLKVIALISELDNNISVWLLEPYFVKKIESLHVAASLCWRHFTDRSHNDATIQKGRTMKTLQWKYFPEFAY